MLALDDPPTAFFCTETDAVTGTLHALRDAGLAIPSQMSVIGFDDNSWAAVMDPPLTMVEQPMLELGRRAAELLLARIDGEGADDGRRTQLELQARLIERESVAPPR
jgi:LacI family transcriptional regulator